MVEPYAKLYTRAGEKDYREELRKHIESFVKKENIDPRRFAEMFSRTLVDIGADDTSDVVIKFKDQFIIAMSSWSASDEGIEYWSEISDKWSEYYNEVLLPVYPDVFNSDGEREPLRFVFKNKGILMPKEVNEEEFND